MTGANHNATVHVAATTSLSFLSRARRSPRTLVLVAALAVLVAAACTGGGEETASAPEAAGSPTAAAGAGATEEAPRGGASTLVNGNPAFTLDAMIWQGYWLSRDHFGPFVMGSGLGIPFEPPMETLAAAMQMVAQNPNDPIVIPQNMAPLQAMYASASPALTGGPADPMDFSQFRLDPTTFDATVRVRAQAQTMLKESQWARNFANPHFGAPDDDFGAQQRFMGVMVSLLAQMQGAYAAEHLAGSDGLYRDSDGALDYEGNWTLLQAFADLAGITGEPQSRYADAAAHTRWSGLVGALFDALENRRPETTTEAASAVRALAYVAWTTTDPAIRDRTLQRVRSIADEVEDLPGEGVIADSARIVALAQAGAALGETAFLDAAASLFDDLAADFDRDHGVFRSVDVYGVDDVAWIIGGLNSLFLQGPREKRDEVGRVLLAFYEATLDQSGLQLSAPPGKNGAMAGAWEQNLPDVVFYHGADTPDPATAGMLPVPAAEIRWNGASWEVTDGRFVTAGAMHLANELNWLGPHLGSVPFPPVQ